MSEISDIEYGAESSDPDYELSEKSEISDIEYESDNDKSVEPNVSTLSTTSVGQSCVSAILSKSTVLQNKHNWKHESVDSFICNYLTTKKKIGKLFKYEMDIINEEVMTTFNKVLFKRTDSKQIRVNKIYMQLRQMPEMLQYETSDEDDIVYNRPKTLYEIYKKFVTSTNYPKEFLAAAVCKIHHMENVEDWERKCKVPIQLNIPFLKDTHIIFNYPEYSKDRCQLEMRTFDYTHILNNLRYHICNRGFTEVSTEAFVNVSKVNHDVLPLAIVEDKLDRQNCVISQRFFSEDVEEILELNGNKSEAKFVQRTRNWYRACDERGIDVKERLKYLNEMYSYLIGKCNISDYPPPTTHVEGIPIRTFEALLHTISTRFSLYALSSKNSYNSRAISTLAVESFFSDLSQFEFSGLGAPKAVDIPKLISHVVHINTTKHDPNRGFQFMTSTRDNYPVYLMEEEIGDDNNSLFQLNLFDMNYPKKRKNLRWFTLSKPKHVTKGGKGIQQFYKINETKLTLEQCFGNKIETFDI